MAREDVTRALEAMIADDGVAEQMADGDFSSVEGLRLSPDEQMIVSDAAADLPEVVGFAMDSYLGDGSVNKALSPDRRQFDALIGQSDKWKVAVDYAFTFRA